MNPIQCIYAFQVTYVLHKNVFDRTCNLQLPELSFLCTAPSQYHIYHLRATAKLNAVWIPFECCNPQEFFHLPFIYFYDTRTRIGCMITSLCFEFGHLCKRCIFVGIAHSDACANRLQFTALTDDIHHTGTVHFDHADTPIVI